MVVGDIYYSPSKANKLRLYEYFNYLLTEIPEHMDDKSNDFCLSLMLNMTDPCERCMAWINHCMSKLIH